MSFVISDIGKCLITNRVRLGVDCLNNVFGSTDWAARITRPVDVSSVTDCPLGQIYGDFSAAPLFARACAIVFGFGIVDCDTLAQYDAYTDAVNQAWAKALTGIKTG